MPPITVVIADQEKDKRTACASLLDSEGEIQVIGEAQNGLEAMKTTFKLKPDILLLSLDLIKEEEIALLPMLDRKSPNTRVILLTRAAHERRILEALSYGASGYLEENAIHAFLPKAIRSVNEGEAWIPHRMVSTIIEHLTLAKIRNQRRTPFHS